MSLRVYLKRCKISTATGNVDTSGLDFSPSPHEANYYLQHRRCSMIIYRIYCIYVSARKYTDRPGSLDPKRVDLTQGLDCVTKALR